MTNNYLTEYLDFYIQDDSKMNFAVLLTGEWGSGKTHFINRFIEKRKQNKKFIYISLYGVTSLNEIDSQIFQRLHPFLGSKPLSFITRLIKGVAKGHLKLDVDGNGTKDVDIDLTLPDIKLSSLYRAAQDVVFIFDDLERCNIEPNITLGYINHFVEHQNHKVIILANELEILKGNDQKDEKYINIKEKLIGRTFLVHPDANEALRFFLDSLKQDDASKVLCDNHDEILRIYEASQYQNLRSMRQAIIEFPRIYNLLPEEAKKNKELLSSIIQTLLVFSFELRKGAIKTEQIKSISNHSYSHALKNDEKTENPLSKIEEKYTSFSFDTICPSDICWFYFLREGSFPVVLLKQSIDNSVYFRQENMADWIKLWHFLDLEESEFTEIVEKVRKQFQAGELLKMGIIKHITGLFLYFSKNGLISEDVNQITTWLKENIEQLHRQGKFNQDSIIGFNETQSYGSLGIHEREDPNFVKINIILKQIADELTEKSYPQEAKELCGLVSKDPRLFWEKISFRFSAGQKYSSIPILSYIKSEDFINSYLQCPNDKKEQISYGFKDRYSVPSNLLALEKELEFLTNVKKCILEKSQKASPLTAHILDRFCKGSVERAIAVIEKSKQNGQL